MSLRYLFGPVNAAFAEQNLYRQRQAGTCLAFNPEGDADLTIRPGDSWDDVRARLPDGWRPDYLVLALSYATVPECLFAAPLPAVGLAVDWHLLWHYYRHRLPACDLVLAEPQGADALARAGLAHVRLAALHGAERAFAELPEPEGRRDIDVLLTGNCNPAIHPGRAALLLPLARLAPRRRVVLAPAAQGHAYRDLLGRARVVVYHSGGSDGDRLLTEAPLAGALLFRDAGPGQQPGPDEQQGAVLYTPADLLPLLEHHLDHEDERRRLAERGRQAARSATFADRWDEAAALIERDWPALERSRHTRIAPATAEPLLARCWQAAAATRPEDRTLVRDLDLALQESPSASLHNALGVALAGGERNPKAAATAAGVAARHFRAALARQPGHLVAHLNLAEALATTGQTHAAVEQARLALAALERQASSVAAGLQPADSASAGYKPAATEQPSWLHDCHLRLDFGPFRVGWEQAGWQNAGRPAAEAEAKRDLLRWRLCGLLGQLTGDLTPQHQAVHSRPDLTAGRARLGCTLASAGLYAEALPHLRRAVRDNLLDRDAARALFASLGAIEDAAGQQALVADRRALGQALPALLPAEPWFAEPAPSGRELASIIILCCNQADYTRLCLDSLLEHTRPPYELVIVDNGSTDETPALLEELKRRPGPARVEVLRNESNVGFPAGCNQAIAHARGRYLVFLNNDTVLTAGWLEGLLRPLLAGWPKVGMVGPVTSAAPPPQGIAIDYQDVEGVAAFATGRRRACAGQTQEVRRLTGFCLLARRDVLDRIGLFDERYGVGFFDDDDLCVRARQAGFTLLVPLDTFIHHFGNRTFRGLGINTREMLLKNFERFRDKWGPEQAAGYQLPDAAANPSPPAPLSASGRGEEEEASVSSPPLRVGEGAAGRGLAAQVRRPGVALNMIVRNEEKNLPGCLQTAADLFDEIVITDTGSADRTREIAASFGPNVRLLDFPWCDSFSAARNESLRHTQSRWVLWLDADDRLTEENRHKLRALFTTLGEGKDACAVKVRSSLDAAGSAHRLLDQVRLFPNLPGVRWGYRVHEQILPSVHAAGGGVRWTDIVIDHVGYQDAAVRRHKLERNLRLLELDAAERPDDSFTLFNLGWTTMDLGRTEAALDFLRRSLERVTPDASITRKLYDLLTGACRQLDRQDEALRWCREGLTRFADDAELLLQQGLLLWQTGRRDEACASLETILEGRPGQYFASVDSGLRGFRTRHLLGEWYRAQGRLAEAELQWRAAAAEQDYLPSWLALGELYLHQRRWPEVEEVAGGLEDGNAVHAALLRARALVGRKELAQARRLLERVADREPAVLGPRVLLSQVLLMEGRDLDAAERALEDVLELDPGHKETKHNLTVLRRNRRAQAAVATSA